MFLRSLILVLAATFALGVPAEAQWQTQTVDNSGDVGQWSAIDYDSHGYPHIAYIDNSGRKVMYAHWNGTGGWVIETAFYDGNAAAYSAIAVDQYDRPHITAALSGSYMYLEYFSKNESGDWVREYLDDGSHSSIALTYDAYGSAIPHVAFLHSRGEGLKYAHKNPDTGIWVSTIVDPSASVGGCFPSVALDAQGRIYISYYDSNGQDLKFAFFNGTAWGTFIVDGLTESVGTWTSLVLDDAGVPHITYYDTTNKRLKHATIQNLP